MDILRGHENPLSIRRFSPAHYFFIRTLLKHSFLRESRRRGSAPHTRAGARLYPTTLYSVTTLLREARHQSSCLPRRKTNASCQMEDPHARRAARQHRCRDGSRMHVGAHRRTLGSFWVTKRQPRVWVSARASTRQRVLMSAAPLFPACARLAHTGTHSHDDSARNAPSFSTADRQNAGRGGGSSRLANVSTERKLSK